MCVCTPEVPISFRGVFCLLPFCPEYAYAHPIVPVELWPFWALLLLAYLLRVTVGCRDVVSAVDDLDVHLAFPWELRDYGLDLPVFDVDPQTYSVCLPIGDRADIS